MKRRRTKKRRIQTLRSGELRSDSKRVRAALAAAWEEVQPSPSQRVVIRLDEKEVVRA